MPRTRGGKISNRSLLELCHLQAVKRVPVTPPPVCGRFTWHLPLCRDTNPWTRTTGSKNFVSLLHVVCQQDSPHSNKKETKTVLYSLEAHNYPHFSTKEKKKTFSFFFSWEKQLFSEVETPPIQLSTLKNPRQNHGGHGHGSGAKCQNTGGKFPQRSGTLQYLI